MSLQNTNLPIEYSPSDFFILFFSFFETFTSSVFHTKRSIRWFKTEKKKFRFTKQKSLILELYNLIASEEILGGLVQKNIICMSRKQLPIIFYTARISLEYWSSRLFAEDNVVFYMFFKFYIRYPGIFRFVNNNWFSRRFYVMVHTEICCASMD